MSEDNYIQFSPKWTMIWISILGLLFIFGIHLEIKKAHSLNYLSYDKQMDTTFVVNPYSSRRGLFYDDYEYVVDACAELVENNQGYDDWIFYHNAAPLFHQISDLPGPYYMFKAANNDTIVVIKDNYLLKFQMHTPDALSRRERLERDFEEFMENLRTN